LQIDNARHGKKKKNAGLQSESIIREDGMSAHGCRCDGCVAEKKKQIRRTQRGEETDTGRKEEKMKVF